MDAERGEGGRWLKGKSKTGGRPPGQANVANRTLKEALLLAAEKAGDGDMVAYLTKMALEQPSSFLALLGRVLPLQLQSENKNTLVIRRVEYVIIDPKEPKNAIDIEAKKIPPH